MRLKYLSVVTLVLILIIFFVYYMQNKPLITEEEIITVQLTIDDASPKLLRLEKDNRLVLKHLEGKGYPKDYLNTDGELELPESDAQKIKVAVTGSDFFELEPYYEGGGYDFPGHAITVVTKPGKIYEVRCVDGAVCPESFDTIMKLLMSSWPKKIQYMPFM